MQVYLNGAYLDASEAHISPDDRGFLFADGLYEALLAYHGRILLGEPHAARMRAGLTALQIDTSPADRLLELGERLVALNQLTDRPALIYAQVTRGSAPRRHRFPPAGTPPTCYLFAKPFASQPAELFASGCAAITVPDTRGSRCDIKTIGLLANVLANEAAHAAGALEALFVRDGVIIEGSHSNVMAVIRGELVTYPSCNYILTGVTRNCVLDLARTMGIPVREGPIFASEVYAADELFLTGTTLEIMPIAHLDGRPIGAGRPGPVATRLFAAYRQLSQ
ncbi:MAG: D-alanine aminotransferase Dat [Gemmatimonadetes bacterium]|nr:D-alanine aminotransferase Dat [Gemmatimonadota bacterium]